MGCIAAAIALFFPRVIIILLWLFSDYFDGVWSTLLWPILGFLFMPLTTLAYAFAIHQGGGQIGGIGLVAIVIAALIDIASWSGGGYSHSRRRKVVVVRERRS